jgi:hypothetical protein
MIRLRRLEAFACGTPIATAVGVTNCGRCLLAIPTPFVPQSVPHPSANGPTLNSLRDAELCASAARIFVGLLIARQNRFFGQHF